MTQIPIIDIKATGLNMKRLMQFAHSATEWQEILGFTTVQPLYKWWQGKNMPSLDNLIILSWALGIPMDEIIVTRKGDTNGGI